MSLGWMSFQFIAILLNQKFVGEGKGLNLRYSQGSQAKNRRLAQATLAGARHSTQLGAQNFQDIRGNTTKDLD